MPIRCRICGIIYEGGGVYGHMTRHIQDEHGDVLEKVAKNNKTAFSHSHSANKQGKRKLYKIFAEKLVIQPWPGITADEQVEIDQYRSHGDAQ